MGRIAIITASNPSLRNTGMVSVDLALAGVLGRAGLADAGSWFTFELPDVLPLRAGVELADLPFAQRPLEENLEELYAHDAIVVWGDFLQARHYYAEDLAEAVARKRRVSERESLEQLIDLFLFRKAPETVLAKVLCFGGSVLYNSQAALSDRRYAEALGRLVRGARGIWMRDPISAAKIAHHADGTTASHLGCDAAFLLADEDVGSLPTTDWSGTLPEGERIGLFVGSRTLLGAGVFGFCQQLGQRLGLATEWLPWMEPTPVTLRNWGHPGRTARRVRVGQRGRRLQRPGAYTLGDLLVSLGRYRLVVTDTYHLAINAWRAGTPAICIGSRQPRPQRGLQTLNDLKKHVLYLMYDAGDLFLTPHDLAGARTRRETVAAQAALLEDPDGVAAILARMRGRSRSAEAELLEALRGLL